MIAIMHDINEQTYVPGACIASLYLLVYKRKHPQTLGCVSAYVRKKFSIIFLTTCATCFSPFFFCLSTFFFCFLFYYNTQQYS